MTDRTHPDSGRIITSGDVIAELQDRIAELEAELEAIGAGGVQALSAAPAVAAPAAPTPEHIAAMERAWLWMDSQADQQSKGGHATFDLMMLRDERDALRAAIDAAPKVAPGEPTQEMVDAVMSLVDLEMGDPEDHRYDDGSKLAAHIYRAVLALAPQQEAQEPFGYVTTHSKTGQQVFYRYPDPPYLDNASECVTVYTAPQPAPATQQAGDVVAYLDVGANGYLDLGSELSEDALQQLPKGRHALVIAGTYGIDGYVAAPQPSPTTKPAPQQAAPGEPSAHQILAITTAYEQGVGKGHQAYKSGKGITNPYDSAYGCDLAWQYGYREGKEQAKRAALAAQGGK